jgi:hypothetical protein
MRVNLFATPPTPAKKVEPQAAPAVPEVKPAQEAYDEQGTDSKDPASVAHADEGEVISLEEASIILGDARVLAGEIGRDLSESERVIQISDALEDLAVVARDIKAATPAEAFLIELVGQTATAGTEVLPEEVIPAMESFIGMSIATEGIIETARRIWEAILNFIKKIWSKIRDFYRVTVVTKKYKATLLELRQAVRAVGEAHELKKTFNVTGATHGLIPQMYSSNVWEHLNTEMTHFVKLDDFVFKDYATAVLKSGAAITEAISQFDPKIPEKSADDLKDKLTGVLIDVPSEYTANGFIGSGHLRFQKHERVHGESADVALERIRLSGLKFTKGDVPKTVERGQDVLQGIPAGTEMEMEQLLDHADACLEVLTSFYAQYVNQFYKTADDCQDASVKASKEMELLDKAEFGDKSVGYYRSMLNFNSAFANWTYEPFVPMYHHTLRVVNSIFILVRGSLSCYKNGVQAPQRA